ncbi:MAG TPA: hypothetical protein VMU22_00205 [Rhizomicrobium sp.]|nr:hypothetical protein [Rhizomicrobium sp.]
MPHGTRAGWPLQWTNSADDSSSWCCRIWARKLNRAIASLPDEFCETLVLHEMEELSYREIARALSFGRHRRWRDLRVQIREARRLQIQLFHPSPDDGDDHRPIAAQSPDDSPPFSLQNGRSGAFC